MVGGKNSLKQTDDTVKMQCDERGLEMSNINPRARGKSHFIPSPITLDNPKGWKCATAYNQGAMSQPYATLC